MTTDPLVGYAETVRADGWSLRSALVRFAQPQPDRAAALLRVVRRLEQVLPDYERSPHPEELLAVAGELDSLADVLARWAVDVAEPPPVAEVDEVTARTWARLDELGVPEEVRPGPPRRGRAART